MGLRDYIEQYYKNNGGYRRFCREFKEASGYSLNQAVLSKICNGGVKKFDVKLMQDLVEFTRGHVTYKELVESQCS